MCMPAPAAAAADCCWATSICACSKAASGPPGAARIGPPNWPPFPRRIAAPCGSGGGDDCRVPEADPRRDGLPVAVWGLPAVAEVCRGEGGAAEGGCCRAVRKASGSVGEVAGGSRRPAAAAAAVAAGPVGIGEGRRPPCWEEGEGGAAGPREVMGGQLLGPVAVAPDAAEEVGEAAETVGVEGMLSGGGWIEARAGDEAASGGRAKTGVGGRASAVGDGVDDEVGGAGWAAAATAGGGLLAVTGGAVAVGGGGGGGTPAVRAESCKGGVAAG